MVSDMTGHHWHIVNFQQLDHAMSMEIFWMLTNHLHCCNLLIQMIGHHLRRNLSLKWQSFYLSVQRCQLGTSMSFWISGQPTVQHQALGHHSRTTWTSTKLPMQFLLVAFPGNILKCHLMVHDLMLMSLCEWNRPTRSTLGILTSSYWICMLADPTFVKDFDYTPVQQFNCHGTRHYDNFMSGDWVWIQAVRMPFLWKK